MMHAVILIAVMAVCTVLLRFLPFLIFDHDSAPPACILYLGRVLPPASIGMLVVYCLKDTDFLHGSHGIAEMTAVIFVVILQKIKHNSILSILGGTLLYMVLIQMF